MKYSPLGFTSVTNCVGQAKVSEIFYDLYFKDFQKTQVLFLSAVNVEFLSPIISYCKLNKRRRVINSCLSGTKVSRCSSSDADQ